LPHFSISDFMNAPNSARVPGTGVKARVLRRSVTSGCFTIRTISALSLSRIAGGVFAGATMPIQPTASKPG
jgi:hypothetical protein